MEGASLYDCTGGGSDLSLIHILDAGKGDPVPQGSASLTGAQFKVSYYGGYYTEETLPEQPDRSWILETREDYLLYTSNGLTPSFPLWKRGGHTQVPAEGRQARQIS